jgi:hypothetical protein
MNTRMIHLKQLPNLLELLSLITVHLILSQTTMRRKAQTTCSERLLYRISTPSFSTSCCVNRSCSSLVSSLVKVLSKLR